MAKKNTNKVTNNVGTTLNTEGVIFVSSDLLPRSFAFILLFSTKQ